MLRAIWADTAEGSNNGMSWGAAGRVREGVGLVALRTLCLLLDAMGVVVEGVAVDCKVDPPPNRLSAAAAAASLAERVDSAGTSDDWGPGVGTAEVLGTSFVSFGEVNGGSFVVGVGVGVGSGCPYPHGMNSPPAWKPWKTRGAGGWPARMPAGGAFAGAGAAVGGGMGCPFGAAWPG